MHQKILLSIEPLAYRELLRQSLEHQPKIEIVGESCNYIECLAIIASQQPQIWIHSAEEGPDLKAAVDRAYELSPQLVVARVNPAEPAGYLQIRLTSLADVLGFAERTSAELECSTWH